MRHFPSCPWPNGELGVFTVKYGLDPARQQVTSIVLARSNSP
jgi:hypothetical protein